MKTARRWIAVLTVLCLLMTGEMPFLPAARAEEAPVLPVTEEFTSKEGWTYRLTADGEAVLTGSADVSAERLELPKSVDGHWVAAVGENAFPDHTQVRSLRAPASIRRWERSAFPRAKGVTVEAYNGSAALRFARERGFGASSLSELDFYEDIRDLSEISSSQYSLNGSTLTVSGPWAALLKAGDRIYLPANGTYRNGVPLRISAVTPGEGRITAAVTEISMQDALSTYRADNVRLYPDWSRAVALAPGVEIPSGGAKKRGAPETGHTEQEIPIRLYLRSGKELVGKLTSSIECTYSMEMNRLRVEYVKAVTTVTNKLEVGFKTKYVDKAFIEDDDDHITLFKVPLIGAVVGHVWAYVRLNVNIDGDTMVTYDYSTTTTVTYDHGKKSYDKTEPVRHLTVSSAVTATLELSAGVELVAGFSDGLGFTVLDLHVGVGFEAKAERSDRVARPYCYDLTIDGFLNISFTLNILIGEWSVTPVKIVFPIWERHFEMDTLTFMEKDWCTHLDTCKVKLYYGFDTGDTTDYTITVEKGHPISEPDTPVRPGYTFVGWYIDEETLWDFDDPVTENMILAAGWTSNGESGGPVIVVIPRPVGYEEIPGPDEDICLDYSLDAVKNEVTITGCGGRYIPVHLVIPETYMGYKVVGIRSKAFMSCDTLRALEIPDTVKTIGENAFSYCRNLEKVTLGEGVESIWMSAFENCYKLSEMNFPDSLGHIEMDAFTNTKLRVFRVPLSLGHAGSGPYAKGGISSNFTKIIVPEGITELDLYDYYEDTLNGGTSIQTIELPSTLKKIKSLCFLGTQVTSIQLPEGLDWIESYAFEGCDKLTRVDLPDSLRYAEQKAFIGCSGVTVIRYSTGMSQNSSYGIAEIFPDSVSLEEVIIPEGTVSLRQELLMGTGIKRVTLPSTMKNIGDRIFADCPRLEKVVLNKGLLTIGAEAFRGCRTLGSLKLPQSLTKLGESPIAGTRIRTLRIPAGVTECARLVQDTKLKKVVFEEGMERLPDFALANCDFSRCRVKLPGSLKVLGKGSIQDTSSLRSLPIPADIETVEEGAFRGCKDPIRLELPGKIKTIGDEAFAQSKFTSVHLPDTVESIGRYAFQGSWVKEVNYPRSMDGDDLFYYAFSGADNLRSIVIPEGVELIPGGIFQDAPLERLVLPGSLKGMGYYAFKGTNLKEVIIPRNTEDVYYSFNSCPRLETVVFLCPASVWSDALFWGFRGCPLKRVLVPDASCPEADWFRANYPNAELIELSPGTIQITFMDGDRLYENRLGRSAERLSSFSAPHREGFSFTGWFREPECLVPWNFETDLLPDEDLTLYAGWEDTNASYTFRREGGGITLLGYTGGAQSLRIPSEIDGLPVTALEYGFLGKGTVSVYIPASVTRIADGAFRFASDLASVTVAEGGCCRVEDGVLYDRAGRLICYPAGREGENYTIPAGVSAVAPYAFCGCAELTDLTVEAEGLVLESFAVYRCPVLEKAFFEADPESIGDSCLWDCADELAVFGPVNAATLTDYCGSNFIPYNMYEVVYMQEDTELFTARARAGSLLHEIMDMDDDLRTFLGWTRDPASTVFWDMDRDLMPAMPLTLYAVWMDDYLTETVGNGVRLVEYRGGRSDVTVPEEIGGLPVTEIVGGCFGDGVLVLRGNKGSATEAYAMAYGKEFIPLMYTVTFLSNGGTPADPVEMYATGELTLPTVTMDGFTLAGWYLDSDLLDEWTAATRMPAHDVTLYAGWTQDDPNARPQPFTFIHDGTGLVITGYTGSADDAVVPAEINGQPVTAIAPGAFSNLPVHTVTLPNSIQTIGERAFFGCSSLRSVNLPAGLTVIAPYCFAGCTWLGEMILPDTLRQVGAYAFAYDRELTAVSLGSRIEEVDITAFRGCESLTSIAAGSSMYSSAGGVLFSADGSTLILYPEGKRDETYSVPDGTVEIREYAMYSSRIRSLVLNAGLKTIGSSALKGSMYLREISMNEGLEYVGRNAMNSCVSLRSVHLPASLTYLGAGAFRFCPLDSLMIDSEDAELEKDCVDADSGLTIFGRRGSTASDFANQYGIRFVDPSTETVLTGMTLPESLALTAGQTGQLHPVLTPADASGDISWKSSDETVASVDQNGTVTGRAAGEALITASGMGGVKAACTVTVSRPSLALTGLSLPAAGIRVGAGDAAMAMLTVMPANAEQTELTWETANRTVAVCIDGCVFGRTAGTTTLTVTAADGLTASCPVAVYSMVFGEPDYITPSGLRIIGEEAFAGVGARVVRLREGVTELGDRAFAGCGSLTQIYIPASCTTFGEEIFDDCEQEIIIFCDPGSDAADYAANHSMTYVLMRSE